MVEVYLRDSNKTIEIESPISVGKLLKKLGYMPFEVLVIKNDKLLTRDVILKDKDRVEIREVYSKG
ncbi:sulfur carrier protein ThiS [Hippea jasoniae]|uniref:sulfur carrier protein ThiS n=1 Tax=Hippea jasoniae TaxID=944479 RepID=UPI000553EF7F|nr:MoaD/ThiS family protein [Hippea jasoniae]